VKKLILFLLVLLALYFIISRTPDRPRQVSSKNEQEPNLTFGPVKVETTGTPSQILLNGYADQTVVAWTTAETNIISLAFIDEAGNIDQKVSFIPKEQVSQLSALATDPSGIVMLTWFKNEVKPLTVATTIKTATPNQQLIKAVISKYGNVLDAGSVVAEAVDNSGLKKANWSAIRLLPNVGFEVNWYDSQSYKLENGSLVPNKWAPLSLIPLNKKPAVIKEIGNWEIYQGQPAILKQVFTVSGATYGKVRKVPLGFKPDASLPFAPLKQVDNIKVDTNGNIYAVGRVPDGKVKKTPNGPVLPEKLLFSVVSNKAKVAVKEKLIAKVQTETEHRSDYATILAVNQDIAAVVWSTITDDWRFLTFGQLFNRQGKSLTELPILLSGTKKVQAQLTATNLVIASSSKVDLALNFYKKEKKLAFLRISNAANGSLQAANNSLLLAWPEANQINIIRWQLPAN
jgi:hypothetical protein